MSQVLEDLRRIFPKRGMLLHCYLIGSWYWINKKFHKQSEYTYKVHNVFKDVNNIIQPL